jgi:hypothetical protein
MGKKKLSIRELLVKFDKATRQDRETDKGVLPVHVPYTKYKGHDFLSLVSAYYGLESRKDAISRIDKAVASKEIFRARVKGGYALFLEPTETRQRSKAKDVLAEIL